MSIIGVLLLIFVLLGILALLLPVKIHFYAAGGTDKGFDITGRVMIYSGLVGCGFRHYFNRYRFHFYIHSWKVIDADITAVIAYFRQKKKKKPLKVPKKEKLLGGCYTNSLKIASENECRTIAFPAISTGVYRFPKKNAAVIASGAVKKFLEKNGSIKKILFVFFSEADAGIFLENSVF